MSEDLKVGRLIEVMEQYIELLQVSEKLLLPLAVAHNFNIPEELVARGRLLRNRIAELKQALRL